MARRLVERRRRRWVSTGSRSRIVAQQARSRGRPRSRVSLVGRGREHQPPRIDDQRATARPVPRRMRSDLIGARSRSTGSRSRGRGRSTSQWSRVVASVNALGHGDHLGAANREDPVQLGEADVVADAHPEPRARPPSSETTDLGARLPRRADSAYTTPSTSTSNMWILRYTARISPSGPTWTLVLADLVLARRPARRSIRPAGRSRARRRPRAPTRCRFRRAAAARAAICSGGPSTLHFSGQHDQLARPRAAASRTRRSAVARLRSTSSVALS